MADVVQEDGEETKRRVLGKFYKRKTRPRQLLQTVKVQQSGHLVLPFTTLKCSELQQTDDFHLPPIRQTHRHGNQHSTSDTDGSPSTPKELTLVDVLPEVAYHEASSSGKRSTAGWPAHNAHTLRAFRRNGMPAV